MLKHQEVSKYYANGCSKSFLLPFMSLLRAPIVKNSHIKARVYFVSLENVLTQI